MIETSPLLLAEGLVLVEWWKPLLLLVVFVAWARIIAHIYDKHAFRFHLPRRTWNQVHLWLGFAALIGSMAIGLPIGASEGAYWAGFGLLFVVLFGDLLAYAFAANRDDRVPEKYHIKLNMEKLSEAREAKKAAKLQSTVSLIIKSPDKQVVAAPDAETPDFEIRAAAEALYLDALARRASQVDIGPTGKDNTYSAKFLVDGVYQGGEPMPAPAAAKMMDFWKGCAKLDVTDRRKKLAATIKVEQGRTVHAVRITSVGVQGGGMRVSMLFDPEDAVMRKPEALGALDVQLNELKTLVASPDRGVVLLAGGLDQGRTSTMYAILRMHDAYTSNVQTVEMEPQAPLEGIRTNPFEPGADGGDFSTLVRSILRRDPDVVAVGDMPDANTAKEVSRCDAERTRVYLSMKADGALQALQTYIKAVGDAKGAAEGLRGVVAQKLVRKLCSNCKVAYPATPDMLKKLGVPEGKIQQLYKKGGQVLIKNKPDTCPSCQGIGYVGQEGVFEVYPVGPEERNLIAAGNLNGVRAAWRKRGIPSLQQAAIAKAVSGATSVEEVTRVTASEQPSAPAPAATAASGTPAPAAAAGKA